MLINFIIFLFFISLILSSKSQSKSKSISRIHNNMSKSNLFLGIKSSFLNEFNIILGSGSPRRKLILEEMLNIPSSSITVIKPPFDEDLSKDNFKTASEYCLATAIEKSKSLSNDMIINHLQVKNNKKNLVICSDTVVDLDGKVLEKPNDENDAKIMLSKLSNREHKVHSSVVLSINGNIVKNFVSSTSVKFYHLNEIDINSYVESQEPMDKAGSYGIQAIGSQLIESINGDYYTVMGLPVHELSKALVEVNELR